MRASEIVFLIKGLMVNAGFRSFDDTKMFCRLKAGNEDVNELSNQVDEVGN